MEYILASFTSLLWYVPYIQEQKAKVQPFTSSFPTHMKEQVEFDNPRTTGYIVRRAWICYQLMK